MNRVKIRSLRGLCALVCFHICKQKRIHHFKSACAYFVHGLSSLFKTDNCVVSKYEVRGGCYERQISGGDATL